MVIVVAVILLIVGIVLPAASTLWRERRVAEAQNTISGMLMTARARAMQDNFGDSGLFFYVDETGVQRIVPITQDAKKAADPATREAWANVFSVSSDRGYTLPVPMRVTPRYAVYDEKTEPDKLKRFDPDELANNDFSTLPAGADQAQRHRNFFTLVYNGHGQLLVRRDVLISDKNDDAGPPQNSKEGDVTGLAVADETEVTRYHGVDAAGNAAKLPVILNDGPTPPDDFFVVDPDKVAINFPSVDGLLVYDESLFGAAGDAKDKRKYLMDYAQPFYVQRLTGAVVRGPVGENQAPITP